MVLHKKILLFLAICNLYLAGGQSFYNPKIYPLSKKIGHFEFKILNVSNDSAYLYHNLWHSSFELVDLSTGKVLASRSIPKVSSGSNYRLFSVKENNVEFIDTEITGEVVTLKRKVLTKDLRILETGIKRSLNFSKSSMHSRVNISKQGNVYVVSFMNNCIAYDKSCSGGYLEIVTMDENLIVLDRYVFAGEGPNKISSVYPEDDFSNGIAYQIHVSHQKPEDEKNILITLENDGKIKTADIAQLKGHFNFIRVGSNKEMQYGYCFNLVSPEKHKWLLSMDKYQMNFATGKISIVAANLYVKRFSSRGVSYVCTKSIVEGSRVKLLTYIIDRDIFNIGAYYAAEIMTQPTFFEFNEDTLSFKYNLPYHYVTGRNGLPASMQLFMGQVGNKTYVAGTDDPEVVDPVNEEAYEQLPPVNTDKVNFTAVFYRMPDGGGANKSPLKDPLENEFYRGFTKPNNGFHSGDGAIYFPFWSLKPHFKAYIVKFAEKEE